MSIAVTKKPTGAIDLSGPKDAAGNVAGAEPVKGEAGATPQLKLSLMILTQYNFYVDLLKKKITDKRFTTIHDHSPSMVTKSKYNPLSYFDKPLPLPDIPKNVHAVICQIKDMTKLVQMLPVMSIYADHMIKVLLVPAKTLPNPELAEFEKFQWKIMEEVKDVNP